MICPKCETEVETNGIGPSNSPKFSWLLKTIYWLSCKRFKKAGQKHDFHYHIYGFSKVRADRLFYIDMFKASENIGWFEYQARKFYLAVKFGGQKSYEEAQLECLKQMNLNSRDY